MFTVGIAVMSFRRGWDLDAVSTPMVTAIGDMVTLPCLFLGTLLVGNATANAVAAVLCTAVDGGSRWVAAFRVEAAVRRIISWRWRSWWRSPRCSTCSRGPCSRRIAEIPEGHRRPDP